MTQAYIGGAAMTDFGKAGPGLRALSEQAAAAALADAGLDPRDVQQVYFGNGAAGLLQGQEMIRGQVLLRDTGLLGSAVINVENACASSSTAFFLACAAVSSGQVDVALAMGSEQLVVPDKTRSFAALAAATDTERRDDMRAVVRQLALGEQGEEELPSASPLMDHYATKGQEYLDRSGATVEDLALLVVKSRSFGALNPRAHFTGGATLEQVLASRLISPPLHMHMCAPLSNGAAAVVVLSAAEAARRGLDQVRVRGVSVLSNDPGSAHSPTRQASRQAYERAGVGPDEVDFAEVHDAAAPAELIIMEELGLAAPETAFKMVRQGETGPGGRLPVNTSGGLMSRGHPIGATGCAQLVELADQLRGRSGARQVEGARIGLAQNGGGVLDGDEATVTVSLLERTRA